VSCKCSSTLQNSASAIAQSRTLLAWLRALRELGVRNVNDDNVVGFSRVSVLEDEQTYMWVSGLVDRTRVIVQGQDFVREGQKVDAVPAVELTATAR
jgi:hypothetical protein